MPPAHTHLKSFYVHCPPSTQNVCMSVCGNSYVLPAYILHSLRVRLIHKQIVGVPEALHPPSRYQPTEINLRWQKTTNPVKDSCCLVSHLVWFVCVETNRWQFCICSVCVLKFLNFLASLKVLLCTVSYYGSLPYTHSLTRSPTR